MTVACQSFSLLCRNSLIRNSASLGERSNLNIASSTSGCAGLPGVSRSLSVTHLTARLKSSASGNKSCINNGFFAAVRCYENPMLIFDRL
ncbi:MAG: hypothetical protein H6Q57_485 [Geobacteraceae bacterium]|nr:hypothetical protein [Geobacteraceae bacterium]